MADADHVIFPATMVTLGSTVMGHMAPATIGGKGELPPFRQLLGTSFTFMGLSILGQFAPGLAGPLSIALSVTAFLYYGLPLLDNFTQGTFATPVGLPGQENKPSTIKKGKHNAH